MIDINENAIEKVSALLHGIPNGAEKAISGALNRSLLAYRTASVKQIRQTYHISASDLKTSGQIKMNKASMRSPEGSVAFAGSMIPLVKFNARRTKPVTVAVLKQSSAKRLEHAYFANLGLGTGIFERITRQRDSSKQLLGPSAAHMADNTDVVYTAENRAMEVFENRLEHEINRLLEGYGV